LISIPPGAGGTENRPEGGEGVGNVSSRAILTVALLLGLSRPVDAQSPAAQPHEWQVEAVGGLIGIAAGDLNSRVDYDISFINYLSAAQIQQQHEGELLKLDDANPIAVRVLRRLSRHWSVGAGFSFFTEQQGSSEHASYSYTVVDPRAQEYQRAFSQILVFDPLVLTVHDYFPHGLARYDVSLARRLRIGASLHAGWVLADCEISRTLTTQGGFYPTSRRTELEMTGRGGGLAGEAWLSAHLPLTSRLALLVEGGYGLHQVKNVTGTQNATVQIQDGEATAVELEQASRSEGRWVNQPVTVQTSSGPWQGSVPAIGTQGPPFTLNLSGWQVRVGVSFGL